MRVLTAIPVYNEDAHLEPVLAEVLRYADDVLVVDDGSTDRTPDLLRKFPDVQVIRHLTNLGYGAGLRSAFRRTIEAGYDGLVTIDCDGQHEPSLIPMMASRLAEADIVSGSRYLQVFDPSQQPPEQRRRINVEVTRWLNECLGLNLTDAFCGFKAYLRSALEKFEVTDLGYAMPLPIWVQAAGHGMTVLEVPVPLIYLDENRAFGGALDNAEYRLNHYRAVFQEALRHSGLEVAGGLSLISPHRLHAPSADGALLAEPALAVASETMAQNRERLAAWDHDFQGRPAAYLRPLVRRQACERASDYLIGAGLDVPISLPTAADNLVVTGHQPELFHPGVWVKNFVAGSVAGSSSGWALNLVIDNDIPKSSTMRVPTAAGDAVKIERVAFDDWRGEVPYEDLTVADESAFASFGDRARRTLGGLVADPILGEFWPRAVAHRGLTDRPGLRIALARRGLEASWGVQNLELPLSALCETEGFLWFACHILAHLSRFQEIHNDALKRYRGLYGIRSRHHPVPALGNQGDWAEAPFWVWRATEPRRRPLMVRQIGPRMELRIGGEDQPLATIPLAANRDACCAVEQLMQLPAQGVRLRTRALTTTMFARFLLGDLFVHGIGGAKYDELGDEIARRFLGIEPPAYLTTSMTLWLGIGDDPTSPRRLAGIDTCLRDLTYNPDRHLGREDSLSREAERWVVAKRAAVAGPVDTHAQRVARFHEIRHCNGALQGLVTEERSRLLADRERVEAGLRRNLMAHNREYSLVLHSRQRVREAMSRAVATGSPIPS